MKMPRKTTDFRENENQFRKECQSSHSQYEKTKLMERMVWLLYDAANKQYSYCFDVID